MPREVLVECSFFMPRHRDAVISDGREQPVFAWYWLRSELQNRFRAKTIAPGMYEGTWEDPTNKRVVTDFSRRYIVALPRKRIGELRALLAEACLVFSQQEIYLSVAGKVEFIKPK